MISVRNLSVRFGRATAVDRLSLDIARGESVALWGTNGAGKTTVIRAVLGLVRYSGRISIDGHDAWGDGKTARSLIGYVPQEIGFYDELRVGEGVELFARLKNVTRAGTRGVLASVGLEPHSRKRVRELSGGMKQRLALALALLGDPPVLLLDEVTASLDAAGRQEFISLLHTLAGEGRTILFASHRLDEVERIAGRVVELRDGRVISETDAPTFVRERTGATMLRLHAEDSLLDRAMLVLREDGFVPRLNGCGVLVPLAEHPKQSVIRSLAKASIAVIESEPLGSRGCGTHQDDAP